MEETKMIQITNMINESESASVAVGLTRSALRPAARDT